MGENSTQPLILDVSGETEESIREIRLVDEVYLRALSERGAELSVSTTRSMRSIHHKAARLMAYGDKDVDVARKTGLTPHTIYRLKHSPAFENLVLHYAKEFEDQSSEIFDRIESTTLQVLDVIQEKLDNEEQIEDTSLKEMGNMLMGLLDRIGHSPVKRVDQRSLTVHLSGEVLERVKERGNERTFTPQNRGVDVGEACASGSVGGKPTPPRLPGSGSSL